VRSFFLLFLILLTGCVPVVYVDEVGTVHNASCNCSYDLLLNNQSAYNMSIVEHYWYSTQCYNDTLTYKIRHVNGSVSRIECLR
jgi:hypothetical protein